MDVGETSALSLNPDLGAPSSSNVPFSRPHPRLGSLEPAVPSRDRSSSRRVALAAWIGAAPSMVSARIIAVLRVSVNLPAARLALPLGLLRRGRAEVTIATSREPGE